MEKNSWRNLTFVFIGLTLLLFISNFSIYSIYSTQNSEIEKLENFYNYYERGIKEYTYGVYNNYIGNYNYDLFSWSYENDYLVDAIDYCESARELFTASNDNYHKAISYFKKANETVPSSGKKYKELVGKYIEISDFAIDINLAMYEACEYLESACNQYLNDNFEAGNRELEKANEKIELHDSYIKKYNSALKELEVLEES